MHRLALVMFAVVLAGCAAGDARQAALPWEKGSPRFQECVRYASVTYCREDIYGHGS
jgi:hypothetical protein